MQCSAVQCSAQGCTCDLVVVEVEPPHAAHPAEGVGVQPGQVVALEVQHRQQQVSGYHLGVGSG